MKTGTATHQEPLNRATAFGIVSLLLQLTSPTLYAQTAGCPTLTNTSQTTVTACSGYVIDSLQVQTTAVWPDKIELVRFEAPQLNPYTGPFGVRLGELISSNGIATMRTISFPPNTGPLNKVYYVYGLLKPSSTDAACQPFALITVTIKPGPTGSVQAYEATCAGAVSANDGRVTAMDFDPASRFEVSGNGIFSGFSQPIPADGALVKNISRTGQRQSYGVRLYSAFGCFTEHAVTLTNALCNCPPTACVPLIITKTRSGRVGR